MGGVCVIRNISTIGHTSLYFLAMLLSSSFVWWLVKLLVNGGRWQRGLENNSGVFVGGSEQVFSTSYGNSVTNDH